MIRVCKRCVMDDLYDPEIKFSEEGFCNYCSGYFAKKYLNSESNSDKQKSLSELLETIKKAGEGKKYDCVVGVSGGVDSTFMVYKAKELGLRPLAVHYDNGWNSELSVKNIESLLGKLDIPLYTIVNDWEEFRDLQLSFFKANVIDIELITDQAILAVMHQTAKKNKIKYILTGHNASTESILPRSWYHYKIDVLNIKSIHRKFGSRKLKTYPMVGLFEKLYSAKYHNPESISLLNYLEYNKADAKKHLEEKIGWKDYGGKHFESIFTRFYQGYILPKKFKVDKRKAHLSALICSEQITREEAETELKKSPYDEKQMQSDMEYVLKKLRMTQTEFDQYIQAPPRNHLEFASYITRHYKIMKWLGRNPSY